jgi:predicted DNA-binding protein
MAKYTIDFGDEFEAVLRRLAKKKSLTKADVLRRAVATYDYLLSQDDLKVALTDKENKVVKEMVLP